MVLKLKKIVDAATNVQFISYIDIYTLATASKTLVRRRNRTVRLYNNCTTILIFHDLQRNLFQIATFEVSQWTPKS